MKHQQQIFARSVLLKENVGLITAFAWHEEKLMRTCILFNKQGSSQNKFLGNEKQNCCKQVVCPTHRIMPVKTYGTFGRGWIDCPDGYFMYVYIYKHTHLCTKLAQFLKRLLGALGCQAFSGSRPKIEIKQDLRPWAEGISSCSCERWKFCLRNASPLATWFSLSAYLNSVLDLNSPVTWYFDPKEIFVDEDFIHQTNSGS